MKMIMAVVQNSCAKSITTELMKNGFLVTKLSSSGGFLKGGNTTLISVVNSERVDAAIDAVKKASFSNKYSPSKITQEAKVLIDSNDTEFENAEIKVGGATIFVLNVEERIRL